MAERKEVIREKLSGVTRDGAKENEFVDELAQRLEDRNEPWGAAGLPEAQARGQAVDELNDSGKLAEELRKIQRPPAAEPIGVPMRRGAILAGFLSDLRIALRNMRTKPAFSLMVIGMLALGVAGNTAIFSIFNGLFLHPLPFAEPGRLIDLDETAPKWNLPHVGVSQPDFFAWRKSNSTFERMAFFDWSSFNLADRGTVKRILGVNVTYDLLTVLGLKPALGRNFLPEEEHPGSAKVTLLGYDLWHRSFQGDRNVLARFVQLANT